jgi:hypothetical protein
MRCIPSSGPSNAKMLLCVGLDSKENYCAFCLPLLGSLEESAEARLREKTYPVQKLCILMRGDLHPVYWLEEGLLRSAWVHQA